MLWRSLVDPVLTHAVAYFDNGTDEGVFPP